MMNIKEAGRYANFLKENIDRLKEVIEDQEFLYTMKEEHYKGKALKDEEDELRLIESHLDYDFNVIDAIYLLNDLVDEKMKLSLKIASAKDQMKIDWIEDNEKLSLDSALEYSKNLREICKESLESLCHKRSEEYIKNGIGYLINQEGNQTPYNYEIKVISTINYDRDIVKNLYRKNLNKADQISQLIDQAMMQKNISFESKYDIYDSLDDIMKKFKTI